jgi:RNA polymerase subunit RPABC4/transcription elongation factor Spt4
MNTNRIIIIALAVLALALIQCGGPTPTPTAAPTQPPPPPTSAPPAPTATQPPPTNTAIPPTPTVAGVAATDADKLINDKFNKVDRNLALWNIQPGLGTVMIEYGNRLARIWYAANAGNWDMAKYQLDEALEIQEVGETTRPARTPMLKAFEDNYLKPLDDSIGAKDKAKFTAAFNNAITGCNGCHKASTAANWKSYQYVHVQIPKADPAFDVDWKGGGQDNYIANPPAAPTAAPPAPLTGSLDAGGVQNLFFGKWNKVDRSLALWNIQPGLGTVMIEYGNRWSRLWFAAHGADWDMAKYQYDEMLEIQEVGETTRPARAPMLKAFEENYLSAVDKAIAAKDTKALEDAFKKATDGCNACHKASTSANWKSYQYVKIQVPTADNADYLVWNAAKGTGSYIANPTAAATATPKPPLTGSIDSVGVTKLISDTFGTVDRSLALWNIQPGLGTVMIEYGRRLAQMWFAIEAGNWDMAKYQLDEATEIQEVGETTRPARAPMLKAFEDNFLKPLDDAILAKDKSKAEAGLKKAIEGCNGCHAASKGANWSSYAYVQIQPPKTDPADYLLWAAPGGTGNYISSPGAATPAPGGGGAIPNAPADHAGRTVCLVCHAGGTGGAPTPPADHAGRTDDVCLSCHKIGQ